MLAREADLRHWLDSGENWGNWIGIQYTYNIHIVKRERGLEETSFPCKYLCILVTAPF